MSGLDYYVTWTKQKDAPTFEVERAEGCHFFTPDGRAIADMVSTSFQAAFGHSFDPIRDAIVAQLGEMPVASPKAVFALKERATRALIDFLGLGGGRIFYTLSGAESVENALKMARQIKGRKIVLSREDSYHGASLGALSITGDWRRAPHFTFDAGNARIPSPPRDPDLKITRELIARTGPDNIAAICLETVSGTNGAITGDEAWWRGIAEICREHGFFLILDEVLCGFYRTGAPFAFHKFGLKPDFVCLAKAITGGYSPLGALWTAPAVAAHYEDEILSCGLTNYAHPPGLAAMAAVLKTLNDPRFVAAIGRLGEVFGRGVAELEKLPNVKAARRHGLLACLDLEETVPAKKFLAEGLYVTTTEKRLFLAPPLVMAEDELLRNFGIVKKVLHG